MSKVKKQKSNKYKVKPLSFYPLKIERVLSAFMKVSPKDDIMSNIKSLLKA
jgi:hypothetical protein